MFDCGLARQCNSNSANTVEGHLPTDSSSKPKVGLRRRAVSSSFASCSQACVYIHGAEVVVHDPRTLFWA